MYNATGTRVEEAYSPMREVVLGNGTTVVARTVTSTVFDDEADTSLMPGRPTTGVPEGGYQLAVEQATAVTDRILPRAEGNTWDTKKVRYRFDPVTAGDGSGWTLRVPTRTLTQDGGGWATVITRYDTAGRLVESRTPGGTAITDGSVSDTYSTKTIYYTADASAEISACRSRPEWDGNPCITKTAGDPASGYPIPAETTLGYNNRGAVTRLEETASTSTRAIVTGYDYLGRETSSSTALTDHTTISGTISYDTITGAVTSTTRGGVTEAFSYDTWGRTLTSTDGTGNTATTSYDTAGRTKTASDGKGSYTYTYDGTDTLGNIEHRGLATKIDLGYATGDTDAVAGAYDPADTAGRLVESRTPGGTAITDGSVSDTYSTKTIYYTASASAEISACRSRPEWDGNPCITKTAGGPASGYPIPAETTLGYNNRGAVTRLEETASTWTRAIVTGYDHLGRETSSSTALTDHTSISGTIGYDTTTGAVTSTTGGGVTEAFSYDTWGRALTSTDGTGNTATTSYDTAGRTKTSSDGKGSYNYTYDGTDTLGNTEHRGLATKIDLGYATGDTDAVAGAYDPAGGLVQQVLPGGYTQAWTRNLAGQPTAMAYTQTVGGTTTPILGFTQTHDHLGRVVATTEVSD